MKEVRLIKKGTVAAREIHIGETPAVERKVTRRERRWFSKNKEQDFLLIPKEQILEKPKKKKRKVKKTAKQLKAQVMSNGYAWLKENARKQRQIEKKLKIQQ